MRPAFATLVVASLVVPSFATGTAWAQGDEDPGRRVAGSVRVGTEYDDNVFRLEGEEQEGGFLSRYFTTLDLAGRGPAQSIATLSLSHGGKFFFLDEHGPADTLLTQLNLGYRHRLVTPVTLWASADMKDRTERISRRDYNLGGAGGGVEVRMGRFGLRGGAAWRYFAFKPNAESSSANAEGLAQLRWSILDELHATAGYTLARRGFETDRYRREGDEVTVLEGDPRRDTFHVGSAGVAYSGVVVAEARYVYALNASNSYGQELTRHSFDVTLTAPLFWRLFASVHVELQRTTYQDPVLIDANFLVDEDNRNAAVASIARAIGDYFEIEARYSIYLQEFGVGSDYRRQTLMLAAGFLVD